MAVSAHEKGTPLSRDAIVDAAIELIAEGGIGSLTMRALADRIGASPMGLYRHVATKQELLRAIAERHLSEVELPDTEGLEWKEAVVRVVAAVQRAFAEHPDLSDILAVQHIDATPMLAATNLILEALREAGVPDREAVRSIDVITCYSAGFSQRRADARRHATDPEQRLERLRDLPPDQFAAVRELADEFVELDFEESFEDGLRLILDGIEDRIAV